MNQQEIEFVREMYKQARESMNHSDYYTNVQGVSKRYEDEFFSGEKHNLIYLLESFIQTSSLKRNRDDILKLFVIAQELGLFSTESVILESITTLPYLLQLFRDEIKRNQISFGSEILIEQNNTVSNSEILAIVSEGSSQEEADAFLKKVMNGSISLARN